MKNQATAIQSDCPIASEEPLEIGELYLFHTDDPVCPAESSLWGVFDRWEGAQIRLETDSADLLRFRFGEPLPPAYRYRRLSTRAELRDYSYNLARWEAEP